jgi:peptidoglycan-associated lipoprotein
MNRLSLVALSLVVSVGTTACHKSTPPVTAATPTPAPTNTTSTPSTPAPRNDGSVTPRGNGGDPNASAATATATMADRIHFEYNVSDISDADRARLDAKAGLMKQYGSLRIRITGHADERGSDEYNIALGMRRATAARDYLTRVGIDAGRIEVASLGRQMPIDTAPTEAAYAANRRDEFDIIAGSQSLRGN